MGDKKSMRQERQRLHKAKLRLEAQIREDRRWASRDERDILHIEGRAEYERWCFHVKRLAEALWQIDARSLHDR